MLMMRFSAHFTGQERDSESGNDNFGARYYSSSLGRFLSPDVINLTNDRLMSPSTTLNKYVYAADNPLRYVDPDGKDITIFYRPPNCTFCEDFGHVYLGALNQATGQVGFLDYGPQNPREAFIEIRSTNQTKAYRVGDALPNLGAVVKAISDGVVMEYDGKLWKLTDRGVQPVADPVPSSGAKP